MAVVHKTVLINYSAEQMFNLVDKVAAWSGRMAELSGRGVPSRRARSR